MQCPECASPKNEIYDSRKHPGHVYRRRRCQACDYAFTTIETLFGQSPEPPSAVTRSDLDALNRHWLQFTNSVTKKLQQLSEKSKQIET